MVDHRVSRTRRTLTSVAPVFRVSDLDRTIAFYREQLGFELEFRYEGFYAGVRREGCPIHLKSAPPTPRDQAAFELEEHIDASFAVRHIEALATAVAAAGVTFTVPLRQMPYGKEFYIRDPDGYILAFVESSQRESESNV